VTDVRKCDGPDCEVEAKLDNDSRMLTDMNPESFITVSKSFIQPSELHFHKWECLNEWSKERTRQQAKRLP
jgi:hypothetical protein